MQEGMYIDRKIEKQKGSQVERQVYRKVRRQVGRQVGRQTDRYMKKNKSNLDNKDDHRYYFASVFRISYEKCCHNPLHVLQAWLFLKSIFFKIFFLMWIIFEVFIEFVTVQFLFHGRFFCLVFFFGFLATRHGILAPKPGIETAPPVLEGKVLTTRPPGSPMKSIVKGLKPRGLQTDMCLSFWQSAQANQNRSQSTHTNLRK